MRVLHVAAEAAPYAKVGGLADVAGSLPAALRALGVDAQLAIPRHRGVGTVAAGMHAIDLPRLFDRPAIYGEPDDGDRYLAFGVAAAGLARSLGADLIHAHDWHAAAACLHADAIPTVLTIHNLSYQGEQPATFAARHGLRSPPAPGDRSDGEVNLLGRGLVAATAITTVSPTYAREILTAEQGCGLEPLLRERGVTGIVNGLDPDAWPLGPRVDLGLAGSGPVIGVVSRLVHQKGLDLLLAVAPALVAAGARLAVVGTGQPDLEDGFAALHAAHPDAVLFHRGFDDALARRVYAGCDLFCMPSRFEPCGLGQLIAMRHGAVPVVRRVGGLADTVAPDTGFLFDEATPEALLAVFEAALVTFRRPAAWRALVARVRAADHGWARPAATYRDLYESVLASTSTASGGNVTAGPGSTPDPP